MESHYDIAIIGGGPAGLSAALTAARGNRSVIVFDSNQPRNAPASHMMNFPSRDGTPPSEFRALIKKDLSKYPRVQFLDKRIEKIDRLKAGFIIDGISVKKILFAHGVVDLLPPIPGMKELFGKSIFHCPYCHGYEHLDSPFGVIVNGEFARHFLTLVGSLSSDLILFTDGDEEPFEYDGVKVYSSKIQEFIHQDGHLKAIKLVTGEVVERSYLFYRPGQKLSSDLGVNLGCELNEFGLYKVNEMGLTTQPGVYAAGDITHQRQSVLAACSLGQFAAAAMNYEILHEQKLAHHE